MSSVSNFVYPKNGVPSAKSKINSAPNPEFKLAGLK